MRLMETKSAYQHYLKEELARRCEKNPSYSLRAFAKACHLSPGELSQVLSGKRIPSYKVAQKILAGLDLSPQEKSQFLNSLAHTHQTRGLKKVSRAFKNMKLAAGGNLNPIPKAIDVD